jgi:hypothetical protein
MVGPLAGHRAYTRNAAFIGGGRMLATASIDQTVRVWDVGTWQPIDTIDLRVAADSPESIVAWPEHDAVVVAGRCGLAYVFAVTGSSQPGPPPAALLELPEPESLPAPDQPDPVPAPGPHRWWSRRGWRFALAAAGEDRFGGVPPGFTDDTWPVCAGCQHPMIAAITVGAHPKRLPLRRHAALSVFACEMCESFEPYGGANAAILVGPDRLGDRLARPPAGIEGDTAVIAPRALAYRRERRLLSGGDIYDKVAGTPDWLQSDETPVCRECRQTMNFVAQFSDSLDKLLNFGSGIAYVFVCPDEHDARFLWQC